jgi:nitrite reductase (NADH) large subunit
MERELTSDYAEVGWRAAQAVSLVAASALVAGMASGSTSALDLFWQGLVPLLPASFLLTPSLWRNLCPLATLNEIGTLAGPTRGRPLRGVRTATAIGAIWLVGAILLRRPLFDLVPVATTALLMLTGAVALATGTRFARKSGFCNSLCPMLPIERIYGQRPMLKLGNPRCDTCEACTLVGCPDLAPQHSLHTVLGRRGRQPRWLRSPTGAVAALLPGLVVAYFGLEAGASPASIAVRFLIAGGGSVLFAGGLWWLLNDTRRTTRLLAGVAAGLYYAFAAPQWADYVGLGSIALPVTLAFLTLVLVWSWRALRPSEVRAASL